MGVDTATLCKHLDAPKYRGSFLASLSQLLLQTVCMAAWWAAATKLAPVAGVVGNTALTMLWGGLVVRSYMIFHDCGHGSFFQGFKGAKIVNWLTLHYSATMCGTPTDWNVGHQLHHANVGNLGQDDYDWGETIFLTASQYLNLPKWKQTMWRIIRHPIPFFALAPMLTWYLKMRLPFELRPERKSSYRLSDKLANTLTMYVRYKLAYSAGIFPLVLAGDYFAMFTGIALFHWQHVYDDGYVKGADDWRIKDAAMRGSSFAHIPEPLKFFTLGIEYHHIHHFRTRMPGYMLRQVHENAPAGAWDDIKHMRAWDMWRSFQLQVWDDKAECYATFNEVLAREKKVKAL